MLHHRPEDARHLSHGTTKKLYALSAPKVPIPQVLQPKLTLTSGDSHVSSMFVGEYLNNKILRINKY